MNGPTRQTTAKGRERVRRSGNTTHVNEATIEWNELLTPGREIEDGGAHQTLASG